MALKKSLRNVGKFILRQDRKSKPRNEYPLYIQYTLDGKVAKGETGVWVQTKDWDDNRQRVNGSDNGHCAINGFKKFVKQKYHQETMMFSQFTETVIDEYIIWRKVVEGNALEAIWVLVQGERT